MKLEKHTNCPGCNRQTNHRCWFCGCSYHSDHGWWVGHVEYNVWRGLLNTQKIRFACPRCYVEQHE